MHPLLRPLLAALTLAGALTLQTATAAEVAGIKIDDTVRLNNSDLVLNGAGLRKKAFFKVYVAGLYLPGKSQDVAALLKMPGSKRVAMRLMRDLSATQLVEALQEGIAANHNEAEQAALKERLKHFSDTLLAAGEAKEGSQISLDWLPESGTRIMVGGQARGTDIPGEDFYQALLRIWLGNKPVQDDLKNALLGK